MNSPAELLVHFQTGIEESISLLRRLVELESHSLDKFGVDSLVEFLAQEFVSRGAEVEVVKEPVRGNALKAVWRSRWGGKPILVLGHLDTVWPRGTILNRPFRLEDGNIFGPGVFDMKSGLLLSLLACRALSESRIDSARDVIFFFTSDEEIGTQAGLPHLKSIAKPCGAVLVLEPCLPGGAVKTSRKGVGTVLLQVTGKAAHAGLDHEAGINAILSLSRLVIDLEAMTDYARGITVNVGKIRGGTATNIVPEEAQAEADFRFATRADGHWIEAKIRSLRPLHPRCTLNVQGGINRSPLERTEAVVELFQKARAVAASLGMNLEEGAAGGGSDGSFTADMGIPTLDGLGVDGGGAHSPDEHVKAADIPGRAALLCGLLSGI